jgi:hypothetical protein
VGNLVRKYFYALKVVYICESRWLLGFWSIRPRDLSQAEKKITVVKLEQIQRMTIIITQNGQKFSFQRKKN